ncbi:MAG: 2-oxo-4-hydroxy-4-carboxy-5-ureidoimidazoline decarboxylase [Cyanobacteria bacterium CRU_2_1]|nr:2-oxo-4-hydroxy-4-carboxy-5-ureidoimidazoline decarboxylase [Cyanobacteria bacterium CRU_2_1]
MPYVIAELNQMSQERFVDALGAVFEESPLIASRAWHKRPFADLADLHQQMLDVIHAMNQAEQIALIQAHPDLGSKSSMATASVQEQSGVGLNRLTSEEYEQFQRLNQSYKAKFGFPFVVAVKNHTKLSILETFEHRLNNPLTVELQQALTEITQITRLRLMDLVEHSQETHSNPK